MMQDGPEAGPADVALPDVCVAVPAGPEGELRIVGVDQAQAAAQAQLADLVEAGPDPGLGMEVVARREEVARVRAQGQPGMSVTGVEQLAVLAEGGGHGANRAGGELDEDRGSDGGA